MNINQNQKLTLENLIELLNINHKSTETLELLHFEAKKEQKYVVNHPYYSSENAFIYNDHYLREEIVQEVALAALLVFCDYGSEKKYQIIKKEDNFFLKTQNKRYYIKSLDHLKLLIKRQIKIKATHAIYKILGIERRLKKEKLERKLKRIYRQTGIKFIGYQKIRNNKEENRKKIEILKVKINEPTVIENAKITILEEAKSRKNLKTLYNLSTKTRILVLEDEIIDLVASFPDPAEKILDKLIKEQIEEKIKEFAWSQAKNKEDKYEEIIMIIKNNILCSFFGTKKMTLMTIAESFCTAARTMDRQSAKIKNDFKDYYNTELSEFINIA